MRFNTDATPDTAFDTTLGSYFDGRITSIIIDGNDNILVGGSFSSRLARLSSSDSSASAPTPSLAHTGGNFAPPLGLATTSLGLGVLGVLAAQKRRRRA